MVAADFNFTKKNYIGIQGRFVEEGYKDSQTNS